MTNLSRRSLLKAGAAAGTAVGAVAALPALPSYAGAPSILKPLPPEWFKDFGTNAETLWDSVDPKRFLTDQARLFVRNHTVTPTIDRDTWRLRVFGTGLSEPREEADALSLSYADLRRLPVTRLTASHECTGNGRSFFDTQQGTLASGTQWKLGAVGGVTWEGVRLAEVLARLGLSADAVSIQATGLDPEYIASGVELRAGAPAVPGQQGPRRRPAGLGDQRRAAAARPRLPGAAGAARLGRHREHQVAGFARGGRRPSSPRRGTPSGTG